MFAKQIRIPPLNLQFWWTVVLVLILLPALYVELTGDFPGHVLFYGQQEDSWLAGVCIDAHAAIVSLPATLWHSIEAVLGTVATLFA